MELVVVGCQQGDEGKGKFTDVFSEAAYAVVRYQGGPNTGHTVVTDAGTFKLKQIPAGVLRSSIGVLGNGCVIDPRKLAQEFDQLEERGFRPDLRISERAHVILPYHLEQDAAMEAWRGGHIDTSSQVSAGRGPIGSTQLGVGPCREDKTSRIGLRMVDLVDRPALEARLRRLVPMKRRLVDCLLEREPSPRNDEETAIARLTDEFHALGKRFEANLCDVSEFLRAARARDEYVVYEGAQSLGLDLEHGTYPFVSTGYCGASGVTVGTGTSPSTPFYVAGVAKAYMTRVGLGPFPTEQQGDLADYLVERGREYGTVTGRRRRVGWFDLSFVRRAVRLDGIRWLSISSLDVLAGLPEVRVATHYRDKDGATFDEYPADLRLGTSLEPVYETLEGWPECDWDEVALKGWDALPKAAQRFVEFLASRLEVRIGAVGVGATRRHTIVVEHPRTWVA